MSITINISPELEDRLKQIAAQKGKGVDWVIVEVLQDFLLPGVSKDAKSKEVELLKKVDLKISEKTWNRYHALIAKRDANTLTKKEHGELLEIVNQIELANAERFKFLVELAQLRKVSLDDLMKTLGIRSHGEQ
ncbi:MAG: hypothetical protein IPG32_02405 [Saprospirales bacterium]|nr:hypothetical protein [Saprospirales bacterium]